MVGEKSAFSSEEAATLIQTFPVRVPLSQLLALVGPNRAQCSGTRAKGTQMALPTKERTEKALLIEIVLVLTLVVGGVVFYWSPVAAGELIPRWWHWVVLGLLFFGIAALHTWRSRRRSHRVLHQVIREDAATVGALRSPPVHVAPPPHEAGDLPDRPAS
jgi:hypothetical protein